MSTASTLPSHSSRPSSPHSQDRTPRTHSSRESFETDSALYQQSKRLAGLSITNSSGNKVSILNDSSSDLPSTLDHPRAQPESPRTRDYFLSRDPSSQDRRHHHHHHHHHQHHSSSHSQGHRHLHRQHAPLHTREHQQHFYLQQQQYQAQAQARESNHDAGRSSSLTNASTPIYSSLEAKLAATNSQRSRSLSSGSKLSPLMNGSASMSSPVPNSPSIPYFMRSYSEDNSSDDPESYRRLSGAGVADSASGSSAPSFVKRKYSCTFPGCNKCFTTSGHLARHNRIHTGERNFACLMPGCPSKFSRQDNMMQHYRTHVSPKSRRGIPKKQDYFTLGNGSGTSQDGSFPGPHDLTTAQVDPADQSHHQHITKMGSTRQGSRQNSPPRFNPFDRSGSVDYSGRNASEANLGSTGNTTLRSKNSGVIQTHQHHTPLPHFNVQAMTLAHQQAQAQAQVQSGSNQTSMASSLPSPLTPSVAQVPHYQHSSPYLTSLPHPSHARQQPQGHSGYTPSAENPSHGQNYPSDSVLASPTSPMTQGDERMEGVAPTYEQERQPKAQQSYPSQARPYPAQSHAGHAYSNRSEHQLPPLALHGHGHDSSAQKTHSYSERERSSMNGTPPSPQSTPHTPTKYRFDPIQDCLQQDKQQQQHHDSYRPGPYHGRQEAQDSAVGMDYEDEGDESSNAGATTRSSVMSSLSSMTSVSSAASISKTNGASHPSTKTAQSSQQQPAQEEMSGLAHLAQIVTTYG